MRTNAQLSVQLPVLSPERRLWRAVLEQAWADAELAPSGDPVCDQDTRTCARLFLRAAGPCEAALLALVCENADVPYDQVVLWARQRYPCDPAVGLTPLEEIVCNQIIAVDISDTPPN